MTAALPLTLSRPDLLVDGRDDAFRGMVDDMLHFGAVLRNARDELAQAMGVSPPQYAILMAVARWPGPGGPSVSDIAATLRVSVPFIVAQNRFLVAASLLDKQPDPTDGRRVRLALTPAARKALVKLAPLQRRINDALFATVDAATFDALRHAMRKLATPTG
jgi:DNA-binding MarR family transcriptional regulator